MARVLLLSATASDADNPDYLAPLRELRRRALVDKFRAHSLTDDPAAADLILFVEAYGAGWHFERARRHEFTRRYREKCFMFCSNPFVIPFLPGIYTGVDKRWASRRTTSGFYLTMPDNPFTTFSPPAEDLPYLFTFIGSTKNSPIRRQIGALHHPRGLVQDTAADFMRMLHGQVNQTEQRDYYRRYAEATKASKFVLCPRGLSVSTIRVFETMRMGRVPVILSDNWVEPVGPAWDNFVIRVPERECANIPRLLEKREHEAVAMGELAREQWLNWFSDEASFHRVVEWCLALRNQRRIPERIARWPVYLQYLRRFHLRRAAGGKLRALKGRFGRHGDSATVAPKSALQEHGSAP